MKIINNITNNVYVKVDTAILFEVAEIEKGLKRAFGVILVLEKQAPVPIASYDKKEDAIICLDKIINFILSDDTVLRIEDKLTETVLIAPDSIDKNQISMSRVK